PAGLNDAQAFSADGATFVSLRRDANENVYLAIRETASGTPRFERRKRLDGSMVVSATDGQVIALAGIDNPNVHLWSGGQGTAETVLRGHTLGVWALAFTPDGQTLATASYDETVKLWDPLTGQERLTFRHPGYRPVRMVFSDDGLILGVAWTAKDRSNLRI